MFTYMYAKSRFVYTYTPINTINLGTKKKTTVGEASKWFKYLTDYSHKILPKS